MEVHYVDRATGKVESEKIYGKKALLLLYGNSPTSRFFSLFLLPLLAYFPWISKWYGILQRRPKSREKIDSFIETYGIDTSEFREKSFASFNDFFIRKLKPECRPIVADPLKLAMPADGRYLVFPNVGKAEGFYVKGQKFDLSSFLLDPPYARRYEDGAMMIVRLCPTDYHRFHFPCDGVASKPCKVKGPLFSVNPIALRKRLSILSENKRMITEIEAGPFGTILYVEIGATCVGTIHQTYPFDAPVKKGDEKGYFSFGGSCIVLLFEKGRIQLDADLIENTKRGLETKANFGESLATLAFSGRFGE
jgi:phosphatidylserine decarboxylase